MQESPDSSDDRGAGLLRPRSLGLASLAVLLIAGAALLYSHYAAGRGAQPVSMSLQNRAGMTSSSSLAAVALNASVPAETAPTRSRVARRTVGFARGETLASSSPEPLRENAKTTLPTESPADS